jgi:SAM-dependent methyltransferase
MKQAFEKAATGEACCVCGATEAAVWRVAPDNLLGGTERFTAVRCAGCGTVRLQPRPPVEAMGRYYTPTTYARAEGREGEGELGKRLDEFFKRQADRAVEAVGTVAADTAPPRLLDVGCGDGRFLSEMIARGWQGEGIETEPAAAALARQRTQAPIHETPLEAATVPDASFDLVSLLHVLEHVPDPRATLAAAHRALAPGGTLLLALPNTDCAEARLFGRSWYPLDLPRHYWGFTPRTLVRLVEECGYSVTGLRYLPFLFAPQSVRYAVRAAKQLAPATGEPSAKTEAAATQAAPARRESALTTRLFLAMLSASERLGQTLRGEVMELTAVRSGEPNV